MMVETKYVSLFDKIFTMFLYILIYFILWICCSVESSEFADMLQ